MPLLRKASNVVQNVFFLYDVTGFTQIGHSIPVATNCTHASPHEYNSNHEVPCNRRKNANQIPTRQF